MKLSPRIRKLEGDTVKCLVGKLEELLNRITVDAMNHGEDGDGITGGGADVDGEKKEELLLMIGNCLRGLALLGKGAMAESAFARVAIMYVCSCVFSLRWRVILLSHMTMHKLYCSLTTICQAHYSIQIIHGETRRGRIPR